ncbi:Transposase IS4 [Popillia japonica]|uniref:Transposase IS4 n=1 Tax=Popillia japonica TaxID=7064 RepID=A0AAW1IEV1_POPJA
MAKRLLNQKELEEALNNISESESEPFSPSESEYEPSDIEDKDEQCNLGNVDDSDEMSTDEEEKALVEADDNPAITSVLWKEPHVTLRSRLTAPGERKGVLTLDANRSAREIDIFLKLFPRSLFMHIAACANERIRLIENHKNKRLNMKETDMYEIMIVLDIFLKLFPRSLFMHIAACANERIRLIENHKNKRLNMKETDMYEIMIVLGCTMAMCYNKIPGISDYWSNNKSLANNVIKEAISRDRCILILSKMYYNDPKKPNDSSKTYYID